MDGCDSSQRERGELLMAELLTTNTELKTVANAIRAKTGSSATLAYPNGFASAIAGIGADCTATAADIRSGKTAYVGNAKITGTIQSKSGATYNVSSSNQTISSGQYLSGNQTIRAVTTSNISAGNIKKGVTVKVGDSADDDRITAVTGTYTSDANATAAQILSGKTAYVNGTKISGTIPSKAAATYNTSKNDQTIAAGQYLSGAQTIRKVTTTNLTAANIKRGVTVKVGDAGDDDRIAAVTGTCEPLNSWITQTSSCYVPYMWRANSNLTAPSFFYTDGDPVGGSAASRAAGFHCTATEETRQFRVPCNIKMTYYSADNVNSTSTVTFQPGSTYGILRYNGLQHILTGPSLNVYVWKIVKWEIV